MSRLPDTEDLQRVLPDGIVAVLSAEPPLDAAALTASERDAALAMAPARRQEFAHGRLCAHRVLARLGHDGAAVPVGAQREPVWPDGIVGSISHCDPLAAAAAARTNLFSGLGLDLERREPLADGTLEMICTAADIDQLNGYDDADAQAKLIFSAKESLFKCMWPAVGRFVDFTEVTLSLDHEAGTFRPAEWADTLPDAVLRRIDGRFAVIGDWLVTSASLPVSSD